jgi:Aerotolerance regulator N-terminal
MHAILIATVALVGLPVLLHLIMKQEPRRLLFPAIRFLEKRRKINQRKMRLRHFLLLLLRMLLIALFGLALFQPQLAGTLGGLNFGGEQPVAAVFVLDASPSMGYVANDRSRLAEAKRRALELLDDLPGTSKVAVLDPAEPGGGWELSVADARRKIEDLKEPRGVAVPVTAALATAYQLLRTVDAETDAAEPMPRLVAVFSDRTAACWDAARTDDLVKLRETIPQPPVAHLFLDVGIDAPSNVAIASIEMKPQIVPKDESATLNATVTVAGDAVEATVIAKVLTVENLVERKIVKVPAGGAAAVAFTFDGRRLKPGLHQVEFTLETPDNRDADNVRYFAFKVAEPRRILTLTDDPADAGFWKEAHDAKGEFACEVRKSTDELPPLAGYEAVCVLAVLDPAPLWPKLLPYVEAGGQLLIVPGAALKPDAYRAKTEEAARLLPGALKETDAEVNLTERPANDPRRAGATWMLDDATLRHPMLAPFREWKLKGGVDVIVNPRRAWQYWDFQPLPDGAVVVKYDDADDPNARRPAVLERAVGTRRGRVLLLTTPLETPVEGGKTWNNYWAFDTSWIVVFPNLLLRHLCGDPTDANFNFATGQPIAVPLPKGDVKKGTKLLFEGRGISGRDGELELGEGQTEVRLPPSRTATPGHITVALEGGTWQDGFALNVPTEEWNLSKVPEEAIEGLFGPKSVVPLAKDVKLREVLTTKFNQPLDLFPWLLIAVLFLLCGESWLANRFYRRPA